MDLIGERRSAGGVGVSEELFLSWGLYCILGR